MLTVGSDMEVLATNNKGEFVALCDLVGGTKEAPRQLEGLPPGYMVQEDNVALEFNIPPAHRPEEFVHSFRLMREQVEKILSNLGFTMSRKASASFLPAHLAHPNAMVFGCEPDYNALTMRENPRPNCPDKNLRTAGGHIHVGHDLHMIDGTRNMDLMLGIPSVVLDQSPESIVRRGLYGGAGAMRPKGYGWEYRTLSNFWMFEDYLVHWIFMQTLNSVRLGEGFLSEDKSKHIQAVINNNDVKEAEKLIAEYGISMPNKEAFNAIPEKVKPEKKAYVPYEWHTIEEFLNMPAAQGEQE